MNPAAQLARNKFLDELDIWKFDNKGRTPNFVLWPECMLNNFRYEELWPGLKQYASAKVGDVFPMFNFIAIVCEGIRRPRFAETQLVTQMLGTIRQLKSVAEAKGHDNCWYNPEVLYALMQIWGIEPPGKEDRSLPSRCEFEQGCREFQDKLYGKPQDEKADWVVVMPTKSARGWKLASTGCKTQGYAMREAASYNNTVAIPVSMWEQICNTTSNKETSDVRDDEPKDHDGPRDWCGGVPGCGVWEVEQQKPG